MTRHCSMFLRAQSLGLARDARFQRHLSACASCRAQARVDAQLRTLRPPLPPLSSGFTARCVDRVGHAQARAASWSLGGVGALALAVSAFAVGQVQWSDVHGEATTWIGVMLLAVAVGWPIAGVGGIVRWRHGAGAAS